MTLQYFKKHAEGLLEQLETLVGEMPEHGDKCEDSQKVCLQQHVNELYATVNGVEDKDLRPKIEIDYCPTCTQPFNGIECSNCGYDINDRKHG